MSDSGNESAEPGDLSPEEAAFNHVGRRRTATDGGESATARPLNVTDDELDNLWELMKRSIGSEEVWDSDDIDIEAVQSLHTKVRDLKGVGYDEQ